MLEGGRVLFYEGPRLDTLQVICKFESFAKLRNIQKEKVASKYYKKSIVNLRHIYINLKAGVSERKTTELGKVVTF